MLILHSSNSSENLVQHLCTVLNNPLDDLWAKEYIVIPSIGIQKWIEQTMSKHFGLISNYSFQFFSDFLSSIAKQLHLEYNSEAYECEPMAWIIESILRTLDKDDTNLSVITNYLNSPFAHKQFIAKKRFELARQLAKIFDDYQIMRPDFISDWKFLNKTPPILSDKLAKSELHFIQTKLWQATLWKKLTATIEQHNNLNKKSGTSSNRTEVWQLVINHLTKSKPGALNLPTRVSIFSFSNFFPLQLQFLQALSKHIDVHLYHINPCQEFWGDTLQVSLIGNNSMSVPTDDSIAIGVDTEIIDYSHLHNPLLQDLGKQAQQLQNLMLQTLNFTYEYSSFDDFASVTKLSRLKHLQQDVLYNRISKFEAQAGDNSILICACHTPLRELQILRDNLLTSIAQNPKLKLHDIAVMSSDMDTYAPFIHQVFYDFDVAVNTSVSATNENYIAFIDFLKLTTERFEVTKVMDFLAIDAVRLSLKLSNFNLEEIKKWLDETEVCWGLSAVHKEDIGLPGLHQNTWLTALHSLLLGYCMNDSSLFVGEDRTNHTVIDDPSTNWHGSYGYCDLEENNAELLGTLADFIQLLLETQHLTNKNSALSLKNDYSLSQWVDVLTYYYQRLFINSTNAKQELDVTLSTINELLNISNYNNCTYCLDVIISWLEENISYKSNHSSLLNGTLNFCHITNLQQIPFSCIAVLGATKFTDSSAKQAINLIEAKPRLGDRLQIEHQQMLDVILNAKQQLLISYIGQNEADGTIIEPPQVVVSLTEYLRLANMYQVDEVFKRYPLFNYSNDYFYPDCSQSICTYDNKAQNIAEQLTNTRTKPNNLKNLAKMVNKRTDISLQDLINFSSNPQTYFVNKVLGANQKNYAYDLNKIEYFDLDILKNIQLNSKLFATVFTQWCQSQLLQNKGQTDTEHADAEIKKTIHQLYWNGKTQPYSSSTTKLVTIANQYKCFLQQLFITADLINKSTDELNDNKGNYVFDNVGVTNTLFFNGFTGYQFANNYFATVFSKLKAKHLVQSWLIHCWNCLVGANKKFLLLDLNTFTAHTFSPISKDEAVTVFTELLALYNQAQHEMPLFNFELTYINLTKSDPKKIHTACLDAWDSFLKYDANIKFLTQHFALTFEKVLDDSTTEKCATPMTRIINTLTSHKYEPI